MQRTLGHHLKAAILPLLALGLASALAACGGATTIYTPTTAATPTATSAALPTATSAIPGGCQTSQLALALVSSDGAAGHIRYLYSLTNTSANACTFNGYATVTGFSSAVKITETTSAYTFSGVIIHPITLAPNSIAYFVLQAQSVNAPGTSCETHNPIIAPPQNTATLTAPNSVTTCDGNLYVSPLVDNINALSPQ